LPFFVVFKKRKKQLYIKYKSIERAGIFEKLAEVNNPDDARGLRQVKMYDNMYEFVDAFETAQREKKDKAAKAKQK